MTDEVFGCYICGDTNLYHLKKPTCKTCKHDYNDIEPHYTNEIRARFSENLPDYFPYYLLNTVIICKECDDLAIPDMECDACLRNKALNP